MPLVHDDHVGGAGGALAEDAVPQDLGDHHLEGGGGVDLVVAGGEAHAVGAEVGRELAVLLLGERAQRRGVDRGLAELQGLEQAGLGHQGLAGAGGDGDEDAVAGEDALEGLLLHRVGLEVLREEEGLVEGELDVGAVDCRLQDHAFDG